MPTERRPATVVIQVPSTFVDLRHSDLPTADAEPRPTPVVDPSLAHRYDDQGEIARGGMGAIHSVLDQALCRVVAKKTLHAEAREPGLSLRFIEEAQITGQLEHPNIVPVYDLGLSPDRREAFFTMKLVTGRTLDELLAELSRGDLAGPRLEDILRTLLSVCDAVSFAHSRGVIHRDLKPANIMVGDHGQVYVMDWGIALVTEGRPSDGDLDGVRTSYGGAHQQRGISGTFAYMAPEQARGDVDAIDERTDVFALGAIVYQILTGSAPYVDAGARQLIERAKRAAITPPEVAAPGRQLPAGLCEIAARALACDPSDRYPTVDALRTDLEGFLRGGGWFATRVYERGDVIIEQGAAGDSAYVIISGTCEVIQVRGEERVVIRNLAPGDVFGETALLTAEPRTASVIALEDVTVKLITPDAFQRELERNSWMGALIKQLTQRFLEMESRG